MVEVRGGLCLRPVAQLNHVENFHDTLKNHNSRLINAYKFQRFVAVGCCFLKQGLHLCILSNLNYLVLSQKSPPY